MSMANPDIPPTTSGFKSITLDFISWTRMAVTETAETMASYQIGQSVLKQTDKVLWLIEKTSQWSLPPPAKREDKTLLMSELTRPLPWILFLPTLLLIRLFRESVSLIALFLGKGPIRPSEIVRFVQNTRRSLRAIKYHGMRNIRMKAQNRSAEDEQSGFDYWKNLVFSKMQGVLCYKVVRYSNGKQIKPLRRNSGEPIVVCQETTHTPHKKRSFDDTEANDSFDADRALKELTTKTDLLSDSDSDDSEFSIKDLSNDSETSETSSEGEDEDVDISNETHKPEDQQDEKTSINIEKPAEISTKFIEVEKDNAKGMEQSLNVLQLPSPNGSLESSSQSEEVKDNINVALVESEKSSIVESSSNEKKGTSTEQPKKSERISPKSVPVNSNTTKPRRSKINYRSYPHMKMKASNQRPKSASPKPVEVPAAELADENTNRSAGKNH